MFFITSVRARIIKGAMAGGLRMVRDMLGDSTGKAPNDMRVRVLWDKLTEKAKSLEQLNKPETILAKNIYFFRDAFCWLADADPAYTKIVTDVLREMCIESAFVLTCSTGDEATVNRLLARKAELEASGALKKEDKPYKSGPTSLFAGT